MKEGNVIMSLPKCWLQVLLMPRFQNAVADMTFVYNFPSVGLQGNSQNSGCMKFLKLADLTAYYFCPEEYVKGCSYGRPSAYILPMGYKVYRVSPFSWSVIL